MRPHLGSDTTNVAGAYDLGRLTLADRYEW